MKKLVLGALLVATTASGCIISSSSDPVPPGTVDVTARWKFTHIADNSARSCPVGYNTGAVYAQEVTPLTLRPIGTPIIDLYDCSALAGFDTLSDDAVYLMWVQIENDTGSQVYAKGGQVYIDTLTDTGFDTQILDDGGYLFLSWDLVGATSGAPLPCASDDDIKTVAMYSTSSFSAADLFTCTDHFGTTSPLPAGRYIVSVEARDGQGRSLGPLVNFTNKDVVAPNGLTDLGHVLVPVN